jgi:D-inositol-3-phosphate glycosyltransferase
VPPQMNICQVILSKGWGGGETVVYQLARHFRDKGHTVSIILNQELVRHYDPLDNVELFNVGSLYDPIALVKSIVSPKPRPPREYSLHNRLLLLPYAYSREVLVQVYWNRIRSRVKQFLADRSVDVVHSHMSESALFVHSLGDIHIPTIATPHGEHYLGGVSPVHPLMMPVAACRKSKFKRALEGATRVTEVSALMLREYEERGIRLQGKSVVIGNGISTSDIQGHSTSKSKLKGEFNLLFPGGAKFVKGGDLAVQAMAILKGAIPGIHLYIALDVPQNHLLRRMVLQHGLEGNVTFSGFLPIPAYRDLLNSVDVLLMPSRGEAVPIACLEAMASGKPIVATRAGGIPEVVTHGRNGLLVNGDPDQIAEAIVQLHRNEELRREMGSNSVRDAMNFDWNRVVDRYLEVYEDASRSYQGRA